MPSEEPTERTRAVVAGLQWGLTQAFVLDSIAALLANYYRATTADFLAPGWVRSIGVAVPVAFVIGGLFGYHRVTSGRAEPGPAAHHARVRFTGALLVGWALAIVPVMAMDSVLGDRLYPVPRFLLPSLIHVATLGAAGYLGYGTDGGWYDRHRTDLLGAVQGTLSGLLVGLLAFVGYGWYLQSTRANFSLDGGPLVVICVVLGGLAGYSLADRIDAGDRGPEFVTLLILSSFSLGIAGGVAMVALRSLGVIPFSIGGMLFYPTVPIVLGFLTTVYLTYVVRTDVYRRLVGYPSYS